jgi:hypothetical protein
MKLPVARLEVTIHRGMIDPLNYASDAVVEGGGGPLDLAQSLRPRVPGGDGDAVGGVGFLEDEIGRK